MILEKSGRLYPPSSGKTTSGLVSAFAHECSSASAKWVVSGVRERRSKMLKAFDSGFVSGQFSTGCASQALGSVDQRRSPCTLGTPNRKMGSDRSQTPLASRYTNARSKRPKSAQERPADVWKSCRICMTGFDSRLSPGLAAQSRHPIQPSPLDLHGPMVIPSKGARR